MRQGRGQVTWKGEGGTPGRCLLRRRERERGKYSWEPLPGLPRAWLAAETVRTGRGCHSQRSREPCSACCGVQTGSSSPDFTVAMAAAGLAKPQRFHPQKYLWERGGLEEEGLVGRIAGKGSSTNAARSSGTSQGPLSEDVVQAGASLQEVLGRLRDSSPTGPLRASESPWP